MSISATWRQNRCPSPKWIWPKAFNMRNRRHRAWEWSDHTPAESLLLKTMRLARLVDAEEQRKWLAYELVGYVNNPHCIKYMAMMGRPTDTQAQQGYWEPLAQIETNISAMKLQMQTLRIPDVSYHPANPNPGPFIISDMITLSA